MRTKRPPMMHIPFAPLDKVTRTPNLQQAPPVVENTKGKEKETPINTGQIPTQILPSAKEQITSEVSSEIKSTFSSSIENDTPAPPGVTECPHCDIDFRDMAVADVRNHVESCSRPTTADTSSDISELSESPESLKQLINKLDDNKDQESDLTDLSDLGGLELHDGIEDYNFDDLPGAYIDNEDDPSSPNDDFIPDIKFPKLRDSKDVLAPLEDIENMTNFELHRRATNVAMVLDTLQREWMALEQETAKAAAGDGPPVIRNPRAPQKEMVYQDRLEADVYGYVHNPHPSLLGKQDPIGQRHSTGDDRIRTRLRKQTKKASNLDDYNDGESSRPVRSRNTPSRFDSESREVTPNAVKKPRGRGKGRVGELRSENDARSVKSGSPLASGNISENGLQSLSALRDRTLVSTEADEEASGNGSRPSTSSSSRSRVSFDLPDDVEPTSKRKKRTNTSEVDATKPPSKKPRTNSTAEDAEGSGKKKSRARQMVMDENGEMKSKQSVMMAARWKKYKENPGGPRIGRRRASESEKGTGSDARSSRKRSLGDANDAADAGRSAKKQKTTNSNSGEEDEAKPSDQTQQVPPKGKRGGFRANSGRKPAKGSIGFRLKRQQSGPAEQFESHHSQDERAAETPAPDEEEPPEPPSSGSTRASKRTRKPSIAKKEADDEVSNSPSSSKKVGGKRAKGKHNDESTITNSKELLLKPGVPAHLQEGMVVDTDSTDDDEDDEDDLENNQLNLAGGDEDVDDDDATGPPKKKRGKTNSSKSSQAPFDDYPDLPIYDKANPSAEYLALPKPLKMKAVSLARWRNGRMNHMYGEKGPNKTTKEKMAAKATSNPSGGVNSSRTSVSAAPSSTRRRRASKITSQGMDGTDEREMEYSKSPSMKAAPQKKKISEYEEFQALASPSLNPDGDGAKRRRRPAALRASTSFVERGTSSDFEDDGEASGNDNVKPKKEKRFKNGTPLEKGSRKGIGGRPPRALAQIQTDVANAAAKGGGNGNGNGSGSGMTAYEEFQALSQPGTPMLLGKRKSKSTLRGGEIFDVEGEDDYEPNDDQ